MKINQPAVAGTLESGDVMIRIAPLDTQDIDLQINSSVEKQFGDAIRTTILDVLARYNVRGVQLNVDDKGALDCILRARLEALLARALMEELRTEIRRRDKALFLQIRSSIMDTPLEELTSTHAVAKQIDTIWKLLAEKGYIMQEDALKSDTIGRACVYMQTHLGEKLTAESVAAYAHISSRHFVRKFRAEMNETFAEYLLRIRIKAAIGMLKNGKDVKSIPEAVGYKDKKSFCTAFKTCTGCSMREYQQRLNLSQREEPPQE